MYSMYCIQNCIYCLARGQEEEMALQRNLNLHSGMGTGTNGFENLQRSTPFHRIGIPEKYLHCISHRLYLKGCGERRP